MGLEDGSLATVWTIVLEWNASATSFTRFRGLPSHLRRPKATAQASTLRRTVGFCNRAEDAHTPCGMLLCTGGDEP